MANYPRDKYIQDSKIDPLSFDTNDFLRKFSSLDVNNVDQMEVAFESLRIVFHEYIDKLENSIALYNQKIQELTENRERLEEYRDCLTGMYEFIKRRE